MEMQEMNEIIRQVVFSLFLAWAAAVDWKRRQIPIAFFAWFGICGAGCSSVLRAVFGFSGDTALWSHSVSTGSLVPGVFSLLVTCVGKGAIGAGDGLFFLLASCYLTEKEIWALWIGGLLCSSLAGLFVIVREQRKGRSFRTLQLPFLPFVLLAWLFLKLFSCAA